MDRRSPSLDFSLTSGLKITAIRCHPSVWRRERLRAGLREIPIGGEIAVESVLLMNTGLHSDPTDQLIVATAMLAGMRLATTDRKIIGWARQTRLVPLVDPGVVAGSAKPGEAGPR